MNITEERIAKRKFREQKQRAKSRNIDWQLTFEQWMDIWLSSGHWHERGCKRGLYCMSRKGDIGAYSVDNVYIQTHSDNLKEIHLARPKGWFKPNKNPSGKPKLLSNKQVIKIQQEYQTLYPFPWGTKMNWLKKISDEYNITVSLADKITNGRCAERYF